jgi:preprotein translocase subunit SecE
MAVQEKVQDKVAVFGKMKGFLQEVLAEQKKIVWPTREALTESTSVVVVVVVALSIYLFIAQMVCSFVITNIEQLLGT